MPTEPMTEQQMWEYLEIVWRGLISKITTYGMTEYSICVDEGRIKLSAAKKEPDALRAAVEFTEQVREEIRLKEEEIGVTRSELVVAEIEEVCSVERATRKRILAVLESQLTELRRGLKEGAFRGN